MFKNRRYSPPSRDIELKLEFSQRSPPSHSSFPSDEATVVGYPLLSRHSSTSKSFSDATRVPDADELGRVRGGPHLRLYVHNRAFNVQQRRPVYVEADGSTSQMPRSALLQSDLTTLLSLSVSILRAFAGAWCVATSWRCAMILLETEGMTLDQFKTMLSGLPSMFWSRKVGCGPGGRADRGMIILIIATILIVSLPAQFAAPLLTGSLTWIPGNYLVPGNAPISAISQPASGKEAYSWISYNSYSTSRQYWVIQAAGSGTMAWGSDASSTSFLKRVLVQTRQLSVNSTVANVTIPYFTVDSLQWVTDINATITPFQLSALEPGSDLLNISGPLNPLQDTHPTLAIIPNIPWTPADDGGVADWPSPIMYRFQPAIVALMLSRAPPYTNCSQNATWASATFGALPEGIDILTQSTGRGGRMNCFVFAQIQYSAGVGVCYSCRVATSGVVQNDTALILEADVLTDEAMRMMPEVIAMMTTMNTSIPGTWNNIDDYTTQMLTRSYTGAWTSMSDNLVFGLDAPPVVPLLSSDVSIAVPSTTAHIYMSRLYAWLYLQLLMTLAGLVFFTLQRGVQKPFIGDPVVEVFLLDALEVRQRVEALHPARRGSGGKGLMYLGSEDLSVVRYKDD